MRFLEPVPRPAPKDIASRLYLINISVSGVDSVLSERLTRAIELYLRNGAEYLVIARNTTESHKFDLVCSIRYPNDIKKRHLQDHIRSRQILPCFGEAGCLGNRVVHVDAKPVNDLDDSGFHRLRDLWSKSPWNLVYEGFGAAGARAASGLLAHARVVHSHSFLLRSNSPHGRVRRATAAVSLRPGSAAVGLGLRAASCRSNIGRSGGRCSRDHDAYDGRRGRDAGRRDPRGADSCSRVRVGTCGRAAARIRPGPDAVGNPMRLATRRGCRTAGATTFTSDRLAGSSRRAAARIRRDSRGADPCGCVTTGVTAGACRAAGRPAGAQTAAAADVGEIGRHCDRRRDVHLAAGDIPTVPARAAAAAAFRRRFSRCRDGRAAAAAARAAAAAWGGRSCRTAAAITITADRLAGGSRRAAARIRRDPRGAYPCGRSGGRRTSTGLSNAARRHPRGSCSVLQH